MVCNYLPIIKIINRWLFLMVKLYMRKLIFNLSNSLFILLFSTAIYSGPLNDDLCVQFDKDKTQVLEIVNSSDTETVISQLLGEKQNYWEDAELEISRLCISAEPNICDIGSVNWKKQQLIRRANYYMTNVISINTDIDKENRYSMVRELNNSEGIQISDLCKNN